MKIGVAGLWHLGNVTGACLAQAGLRRIIGRERGMPWRDA